MEMSVLWMKTNVLWMKTSDLWMKTSVLWMRNDCFMDEKCLFYAKFIDEKV
jgi:hypothetical protein